ncbi:MULTISPECIES: ATP-binding protein [Streptomyces]|uniref:ATP-binding protein n=1 Tax=Streptomyces spinosisporus TaxID=2927582 RepID=A0ABS9XQY9_9ACTN|nr:MULTISPECIES: ATP-binding protein [Streptomyces]MCI3244475.1 ATP-binding protein [Streptomyces spinosisporus]WUB39765.1 ATP-binding protein [Streptomyces sp. NBC_00588]
MARRPLPRILSTGSAQIARGRELARTAADSATDVLHPLISITRGLRRLAAAGRRKWADTPKDRRGPLLFLVASVVLVVALLPYGPLLAVISVMAAAAWHGREQRTPPAPEGPDESQAERLNSLYEALVPYFSLAGDPSPLYAHGGEWQKAFPEYAFDESGRVTQLVIRYPAYFTDGEIDSRTRIEQLLHAKCGRGREYHFAWDEEGNRLTVTVLPPLPTDVAAQRFVTAPGETVLGITDPTQVRRTLPLTYGEEQRDVPPVVWRTGVRSTEPHLLIMGQPGSGTSSLLRSIALQALHHGDVVIVEGGTGEYACFTGRKGVLAVECGLTGALASLEWAATETERRLIAANRARQAGHPPPEDTRRPLWLLLDRPSAFAPLAAADGRKDPQSLLQVPLRHGRAANVTVVVADQFDHADALSDAVRQHTRARVVLGPATADQLAGVLGALPATTPAVDVPPGRGYARLGAGPVHRLQVPSTPDPYDDETGEADREAVLALLPPRTTPLEAETIDPAHTDPVEAEPLDTDRFQTQPDDIEPTDAEPTAVNPTDAKPLDMKKAPVEEEEPETEPLPTKAVAAEAP